MRKESQMERNKSLSTHGSFSKIRFLSILSVYDVIQAATLGDIQIEGQATFPPSLYLDLWMVLEPPSITFHIQCRQLNMYSSLFFIVFGGFHSKVHHPGQCSQTNDKGFYFRRLYGFGL